jgi:hypothetical protein
MVREVRIYVEGGGSDKLSWRTIRVGFSSFLDPLRQLARSNGAELRVIPGGSRNNTFEEFQLALKSHPDAFNILLVDSESQVVLPRLEHLRQHDPWDVSFLNEDQCHFMAQTVEAWLVSDPDTLAGYYGQGFLRNAFPGSKSVEDIPKDQLLKRLNHATRKTQKGPYEKIRHCADLLARLNRDRVRQRAGHCDLLFRTLEARIGRSS